MSKSHLLQKGRNVRNHSASIPFHPRPAPIHTHTLLSIANIYVDSERKRVSALARVAYRRGALVAPHIPSSQPTHHVLTGNDDY